MSHYYVLIHNVSNYNKSLNLLLKNSKLSVLFQTHVCMAIIVFSIKIIKTCKFSLNFPCTKWKPEESFYTNFKLICSQVKKKKKKRLHYGIFFFQNTRVYIDILRTFLFKIRVQVATSRKTRSSQLHRWVSSYSCKWGGKCKARTPSLFHILITKIISLIFHEGK